jgi:hypothetical protein
MRWDTEPPRYATYDPTPDDEAQAIADREWESEMNHWHERLPEPCPCCGRRDC